MGNEVKLTPEELDCLFPPSDPAKYDAWLEHQVKVGAQTADDPNTVWIPHEQVFGELEEHRKEWRERAAKKRNVA